jgi:prophage regulatory protein
MSTNERPKARLLPRREVEARVGRSRSWIYSKMARGDFPRPVEVGPGSVGWLESEIEQWLASLPRRNYEGQQGRRRG